MMADGAVRWGTWEELVLGGAVLRHGAADWDAVAAELQARTPFAHLFTPQVCEAKYEELQERYSGSCDAWFEELRKRRVAELKRELEKSEDSIGSLQSKLETLSAERQSDSNTGYNPSRTESPSPIENVGDVDSSSKDVSKDGSSAGSFTQEMRRDWSSVCQNLASVSAEENDLKMELLLDSGKEKVGIGNFNIGFVSFRKKRGKRKRKGCSMIKEGSMGDSETVSSAARIDREEPSEGCKRDFMIRHDESGASAIGECKNVDLARILSSLMEQKDVSVFRRRLDSQKRAKYRKMIRQHLDLQTISSRISNGSVSSTKELLRDLLLLANNVFVFYPKDSPEHKSALLLRDLVNRALQQNSQHPDRTSGETGTPSSVLMSKLKKVRSMRPCNRRKNKNAVIADEGAPTPATESSKKGSHAHKSVELPARKRSAGRPAKGGQRSGRRQEEGSIRGRKRARRK